MTRKRSTQETCTKENDGRRNDTREQLLAGALRLLVREGYEGTTTGRIAKEGGVRQSSFYSHFESRDACLVEAIRARGQELIQALAARRAAIPAPPEGTRAPPEALRAGFVMGLTYLAANPDSARAWLSIREAEHAAGEAVRGVLATLRDGLVADLPRFGITDPPSDAAMRIEMVMALVAQAAAGLRSGDDAFDDTVELLTQQTLALFSAN